METIIKNLLLTFGPIIAPLVLGGAFLSFLLKRLERRDAVSDRGFLSDQDLTDRARFWEACYRTSDAHGRHLAQMLVPCIEAYNDGNHELVEAFLEIFKSSLGEERDGKWQPIPYPNVIAQTRQEWDRIEGEKNGTQTPQT